MRGSVLVLALLIFAMCSLVVATLASTAGLQLAIAEGERGRGAAHALARAGLERARYELETNAAWSGTAGEVRHEVDQGYRVTVARDATVLPVAVTITSIGRAGWREATIVSEGRLRPFHTTVALSLIGGPIRPTGNDPVEIEGDIYVHDPAGPAIATPSASVRSQGAIYDTAVHALPPSCSETGYFARRRERPPPAPDLAALKALATTPGMGELLDPAPGSISGTKSGVIYAVLNTDLRVRDLILTGTLVVEAPAEHAYFVDFQQTVTITATFGPSAGLAVCAPKVKLSTLGPAQVDIRGMVLCGAVEMQSEANSLRVRMVGPVISELPVGGVFEMRGKSWTEIEAGTALAANPFGLVPGSWRLETVRLEER